MKTERKNSGQVLILGIVMILILLLAIFFFFDVHNVLRGKMKLENAEQSAALAAARWQAESLNLLGEINLLIATEAVLADTNIAIPEHLKSKEVSVYVKGNARILALNEMQSRITFIGPLIALNAAQQTAKNNGVSPVRETNSNPPQNIADDFKEYYNRLNSENNIYLSANNTNIHGYLWQMPYRELLLEIINNGIAVRPSASITGIEGISPSYLGDKSLYSAIIACSKDLPAWCHWNLRELVKMPDSYFEGKDWYTPDFSWIRFSQQSEIYPLEVTLNTGTNGKYSEFAAYGGKTGSKMLNEREALKYQCRFYQYNNRWFQASYNYSGPVTTGNSPWRRGIFLRKNIADYALYGGASAYAECVGNMPSITSFKSYYSSNQAGNIARRNSNINRDPKSALVKKTRHSDVRVGGNYTVDMESSGCVAKPIGKLNNSKNPITIPIILPVFDRVNLIPSTMQKVRVFTYNWPIVEKFVVALKILVEDDKSIYDDDDEFYIPTGAEYMLEALRLLGQKEFRRKGYNPDYSHNIPSGAKLLSLFDRDKRLYDPKTNPSGPGWLQQPMLNYSTNMKLPPDAYKNSAYFYTAETAELLNENLSENEIPYTSPPDNETWIFRNGTYLRARNGKFCEIMEDDPYEGCGVLRGGQDSTPSGTNSGPDRL